VARGARTRFADWVCDPDPAKASEVEISFTPEGPAATLVVLKHSKLERHGEAMSNCARYSMGRARGAGFWSAREEGGRRAGMNKPVVFLRIASVLTLIHAVLHTIGGVFGSVDPGPAAVAVAAMKANQFW